VFLWNIAAHSLFFAHAVQDTTVPILKPKSVKHYVESVFEESKLTKTKQKDSLFYLFFFKIYVRITVTANFLLVLGQ
jgi:hypothetical protein